MSRKKEDIKERFPPKIPNKQKSTSTKIENKVTLEIHSNLKNIINKMEFAM